MQILWTGDGPDQPLAEYGAGLDWVAFYSVFTLIALHSIVCAKGFTAAASIYIGEQLYKNNFSCFYVIFFLV
jgi:hypothetical protein